MLVIRRGVRQAEDIPVSSQADIAFLLIIFFMVSAVFTASEGLSVFLPRKDALARTLPAGDLCVLEVAEDGRILFRGSPIALDRIKGRISELKEKNPRTVALLKIHEACAYGTVVGIVNELQKVPDLRISFRTEKGR